MDLVKERQDAQIWNAIEAGNLKQALKLVDKRLAKKHTAQLEALKILIRSKSSQLSEKSNVLLHLEKLNDRKPAITDSDVIALYDEALEEVLPGSNTSWAKIIGALKWLSVKAAPKNQESSRDAFRACLAKDDIDHARQSREIFPKQSQLSIVEHYYDVHVLSEGSITRAEAAAHIPQQSQHYPDTQKKLWGALALAQITKLAGATQSVQDPDPKQPALRSIQTPQELLLLHRILQTNSKTQERLAYLNDTLLGPASSIAKGEWELRRFHLMLMQNFKQWQELFELTIDLLRQARTKDKAGQLPQAHLSDWIVWDACIRSAIELRDTECTTRLKDEVKAHLDSSAGIDKSWRRNASLAWIRTQFEATKHLQQPSNEAESSADKPIVLLKYLEEYGETSTAFDDLTPFLEEVSTEDRSQLVQIFAKESPVTTAREIVRATNCLKLTYLLRCSLPEHERRISSMRTTFRCSSCSEDCGAYCRNCLQSIAETAMKCYFLALKDDGSIRDKLLSTDRHPADDIAVLAVVCLVKLFRLDGSKSAASLTDPETSYILQATALLEYAGKHSKANFQINLMLIRLYSYLGCGSLAMRAYQRLGIKQIQYDTLSYILFERISTLHPHPFSHSLEGITDIPAPSAYLARLQKYYGDASAQITKNIWKCFLHDSYNSIFEMQEVEDRLERSMCAARCVVESRRIARLTEPGKPSQILPKKYEDETLSTESTLSDNNDYATYPSFETSLGPSFSELTRFSPKPSSLRLRAAFLSERLHFILTLPESTSIQQELDLQWLKSYVTQNSTPISPKGLTVPEYLAAKTYHAIACLLREAIDRQHQDMNNSRKSTDKHSLDLIEVLESQSAYIKDMERIVPAFEPALHALYTTYEVACLVLEFSSYIRRLAKGAHGTLPSSNDRFHDLSTSLNKLVVEKCATIRKELDEGGWIDQVLDCLALKKEGKADMGDNINEALSRIVGDDFMEEWAGLCVESWRESVIGLALLKAPKL